MTAASATWIGSISVLLWGTLALLTKLTGGQIPEFQLMAMTFTIAFALMCVRWFKAGHTGIRFAKQSGFAWTIGVVGPVRLSLCLLQGHDPGTGGRGQPAGLSLAAVHCSVFGALAGRVLAGTAHRRRGDGTGWLLVADRSEQQRLQCPESGRLLSGVRLRLDLVVLFGAQPPGQVRAHRCRWLVLRCHHGIGVDLPPHVGANGVAEQRKPVGLG
jgi:hypothetical protein